MLDPNALDNLPAAGGTPQALGSTSTTSPNISTPSTTTPPAETSSPAGTSPAPQATLQQIISYSKANPNTDYAKRAAELISTGAFDEQAQKENVDLSWAGRPALKSKDPANLEDQGILGSEKNFGHSIADAIAAPGAADIVSKNLAQHSKDIQTMSDLSKKMKAAGQDTTAVDNLVKRLISESTSGKVPGTDLAAIVPSVNKTGEQIAGEAGGVLADTLTFGGGLGPVAGGAAIGATRAMQNNKSTGGVVTDAVIGAAIGKVLDVGFKAASPWISKQLAKYGTPLFDKIEPYIPEGMKDAMIKLANSASQEGDAVATKAGGEALNLGDKLLNQSVEDTMPYMSKDARVNALRSSLPDSKAGTGGAVRKGFLGTSTPMPTAKDVQVGMEAHPYITGVSDPVERIQNVNQGIQDMSSKVDQFLDTNKTPSNFDDIRTYMEASKPSSTLLNDPGASQAYKNASSKAIDTLNLVLKDSAKASGDFGKDLSGADIRKARIAIDKQISEQLGETTFDSPQYKGIKAAEMDTRNLINRMNEDMLRYPGQLDKVNRMNEFISASKERGIEIDMNNPATRSKLEQQFGLERTAESEANAQKLADQHEAMSNLYTARDNMIDRYQSSLGKNKISEWIKANPAKAKAIGWTAGLVGAGEVYSHLK